MTQGDRTDAAAGLETPLTHTGFTYDHWLATQDIPIYKGYYVEDLRTIELAPSSRRSANAAIVQLTGQEGIAQALVTEIPAGADTAPLQLAFDEVVYVLSGRGAATVANADNNEQTSFEWQRGSMFLVPRNSLHRYHNTHGSQPARLLHYSYLPMAMSVIPDPDFFFNNGYASRKPQQPLANMYEEAQEMFDEQARFWGGRQSAWIGRFFPDMATWDRLDENTGRGAGGSSVIIEFPGSELSCHMSVFATRTYKKAHRHGPGRVIVIPAGEGYSIMWEEGKDKVIVPWHEGSVFVPPDKWFHQHFNLGATPARYLALHPPMQFYGHAEKVEDRAKDQIEYPDEDPWIREYFEEQIAKKGLTSLVPAEAYAKRDYDWYAKKA